MKENKGQMKINSIYQKLNVTLDILQNSKSDPPQSPLIKGGSRKNDSLSFKGSQKNDFLPFKGSRKNDSLSFKGSQKNDSLPLSRGGLGWGIAGIAKVLFILLAIFCGLTLNSCSSLKASEIADSGAVYQQRVNHSPDGIGKFYMGREIAQVMGHTGALWLERSSREVEEQPTRLINALNLKTTDIAADIGAGTGYFSFRIAPLIPQGKVLAVDIQPEMLDIINFMKKEKKIANVEPVLGSITSPNLPENSVDLALMVDAYHEFSHPREMMTGIVKALKPGGRAILVEYRGENPFILIKALHKMTQKQVRKEMNAVGLQWLETKDFLPQQHVMIFQK